jgi:hypothetical protein
MIKSIYKAAASGALLAMASTPAVAAPGCWSAELLQAAKLRQLDVMLMVGSLRCRTSGQDYRASYDRFLLRHRPMLGKVNQAILTEMRAKLGPIGALEALDQASVRMANQYGEQASYGCNDLGQVTAALADSGDEALPKAADVLVGEDIALTGCPVQVAVAALPMARR